MFLENFGCGSLLKTVGDIRIHYYYTQETKALDIKGCWMVDLSYKTIMRLVSRYPYGMILFHLLDLSVFQQLILALNRL